MPVLHFTLRDGQRATLNVRLQSTVLLLEGVTSYTFDFEGRLVGAFIQGRNYRRSLANEILEKANGPRPGLSGRLRRLLPAQEVRAVEDQAYAAIALAIETLAQAPAVPEEVHSALSRVAGYSCDRLECEKQVYRRLYRPVTILPPDQYLALYLQATEGCSYNACTFCGFYRDRSFRTKTLEEFQAHIRSVRAFFGGALSLRRSVFLGDANALLLPQENLVAMFQSIQAEFAILPHGLNAEARRLWEAAHPIHMQGIYSFVDAFTTRRKTAADFHALHELGLRRVYVGLESGHGPLLRFLGKPNTPEDVLHLVQHLKAGGLGVGIVILVGAGGDRYQEEHVSATARLIRAMPLDAEDLIYLSELIDYPGSAYSQRAREAGIVPLTPEQIEAQVTRLRVGFSFSDPAHAPRVSPYDIREFVY